MWPRTHWLRTAAYGPKHNAVVNGWDHPSIHQCSTRAGAKVHLAPGPPTSGSPPILIVTPHHIHHTVCPMQLTHMMTTNNTDDDPHTIPVMMLEKVIGTSMIIQSHRTKSFSFIKRVVAALARCVRCVCVTDDLDHSPLQYIILCVAKQKLSESRLNEIPNYPFAARACCCCDWLHKHNTKPVYVGQSLCSSFVGWLLACIFNALRSWFNASQAGWRKNVWDVRLTSGEYGRGSRGIHKSSTAIFPATSIHHKSRQTSAARADII